MKKLFNKSRGLKKTQQSSTRLLNKSIVFFHYKFILHIKNNEKIDGTNNITVTN